MPPLLDVAGHALAIGAGATAVLDLWSLYQSKAFAVRGPDFRLLGRLLGHLAAGRLPRGGVANAAPVCGEQALGWMAHYAIGIILAGVFLLLCGPGWEPAPTLAPALAFGLATVFFPFFVLQPAMGSGFAASKTPDPTAARLRSIGGHVVYGIGLYATASLMARL